MAGRIALGVIAAVLLVCFGYAVRREEVRQSELPFRVRTIVTGDGGKTVDGLNTPYTVLVYEGQMFQRTVKGVLGNQGEIVWMVPPDKDHSR
jgi:hypothetical protein